MTRNERIGVGAVVLSALLLSIAAFFSTYDINLVKQYKLTVVAPFEQPPQRPLTVAPCSATTPQGVTFDPCDIGVPYFDTEFYLPLTKFAYFTKWKAANPNEWNRILAFLNDGQPYTGTTVTPVVASQFGKVVRFGFVQCKQWNNDPTACAR